jgi:hypothetical protein
MTNLEYIFLFAEKHNFPKTDCEVIFDTANTVGGGNIYTMDDYIISVKFDKSLVANELKMEDIRFDIDSDFDTDVFEIWQKDDPTISFRSWIAMGRYIPTVIENADFFDELESLTKDIEMKLETLFSNISTDNGDSDEFEFDMEEDDGD